MTRRLTALVAAMVTSISAAEFQSGQAARAVIGQSSFSSHEAGIVAHALSASRARLYAADASNHLLTFDLTRIPGPKDDLSGRSGSACSVCGFSPIAVANQAVTRGVATAAAYGKTVVLADPSNHRVLIWRDTSLAALRPDVVLGHAAGSSSPISASTLTDPVSVAFDGKRLFVGDAALHRVLVWNNLPVYDDQPADVVLGQADFASTAANDVAGASTVRNPAALVFDGTNLYVADAADRRILVFTPGDTSLTADSVVNAASLSATPLVAGGLATIRAKGYGDSSPVEVFLNGVPASVLSTTAEEIQIQVPFDLGAGTAGSLYLRSEHANGTVTVTNAVAVRFANAFPGLYAFGGQEPRAGLLLHAGAFAENGVPVTSESPAKPGEVITIWGTGLGDVSDDEDGTVVNALSAWIDGSAAEVVSAKLPHDALGVYEIRIVLPADAGAKERAELYVSQAGNTSNTVTFPVERGNP